MDILATFPTVTSPEPTVPRKDSVSCAKANAQTRPRPRRSRSIMLLAVVAACTWATVWWLEQRGNGPQPAANAAMATVEGVDGESVTR